MELGESPTAQEIESPAYDAVNILTVHGSKGLEFPVVFLINLKKDRFPTKERKETIPIPDELIKEILPEGDYHLQEERRLFYVGLTRAKDLIYLTASKWYGEAKRERKLSVFVIDTLTEEFIQKKELMLKEEKEQMSIFEFKKKSAELKKIKQDTNRLSFSQIDTFLTCPLKYKYNYVLDIPVPRSATLIFGEIIHTTLQNFYNEFKTNKIIGVKKLLEIYKKSWIPIGYSSDLHQTKSFKEGVGILKKYFNKFHNKGINILDVEKRFKIKINKNIYISGIIDRVDHLANDGIEIIDYKTGKKPNGKYLKNDLQISIYFLAAIYDETLNKNPENINLTYYFLQDQCRLSFQKKPQDIQKIKARIIDIVKSIKTSEFLPKKGNHCNFCPYKMICEAWQ